MVIRDEVKGFKRDRVLEAASDLFYERGFAGTTMQAVAERLEVTKPFIYSYFKDKNALLVEIYERATEPLMQALDGTLKQRGAPKAQLAEFISSFARLNMQYRKVSTIFLREETHLPEQAQKKLRDFEHSFDDKLTKLIQRGIDSGDFKIKDARLAALAIGGMVRWIHRWYREGGRLPQEAIAQIMADLAVSALHGTN